MLAGRLSDGGVTLTLTRNVALVVFACVSSAVQVTNVVPFGNVEPEAGEQIGVTDPLIASTAVTVNVTTGLFVTISAGTVRTGPTVSVTSTGNVPIVEAKLSVAVQVTSVVPSG